MSVKLLALYEFVAIRQSKRRHAGGLPTRDRRLTSIGGEMLRRWFNVWNGYAGIHSGDAIYWFTGLVWWHTVLGIWHAENLKCWMGCWYPMMWQRGDSTKRLFLFVWSHLNISFASLWIFEDFESVNFVYNPQVAVAPQLLASSRGGNRGKPRELVSTVKR